MTPLAPSSDPTATALSRRSLMASGFAAATLMGLGARATAFAAPGAGTDAVVPFKVAFKQADLDDLKRRLTTIRWPDPELVSDRSQGIRTEPMRALMDHWRDRYDMRRIEHELNAYPQFRTRIDGVDIYFLHIRSKHAQARPMIMTHGWPGSVLEFMKTIGPLTDPTAHGGRADQAFHLVIPALPGFGFSGAPTKPGWSHATTARAWSVLMRRLGYERYVAQGGDWGAIVTTLMARDHVPGLDAIHLNFPIVLPRTPPVSPTPQEAAAMAALKLYSDTRSGYFTLMANKPQTAGFLLSDSPLGQAAWMYDHYVDATQSGGVPETVLTRDEILDEIMLYWITNTGASSARTYWENRNFSFAAIPLDIPTGISVFPGEVYLPPRSWGEATYSKLIWWNYPPKGGHFAALEQPALFVDELRNCFGRLASS